MRLAVLLLLCHVCTLVSADTVVRGLNSAIEAERFRQITSVLVAANGRRTVEAYWHGADKETLHDTRSATKTLVALAVGAAIDQGLIESVHDPAFRYFDREQPFAFDSETKQAITIRDLLTMSSALDCDDNRQSSPGNEGNMHNHRRWRRFVLDLPTAAGWMRGTSGFGPFRYCTAGSFLLGQLVEQAAGRKFHAYFQQHVADPLGIPRIDWYHSGAGEIQTGGGAEMTSRDLLKLGELMLNGGLHGEQRVLSAAWVEEMLTPHVVPNDEQRYGYQTWYRPFRCGNRTTGGWYMAGNGGNKVAVFRDLGLTVVVTATLYGTPGMHEQTTQLIEDHVLAAHPRCGPVD